MAAVITRSLESVRDSAQRWSQASAQSGKLSLISSLIRMTMMAAICAATLQMGAFLTVPRAATKAVLSLVRAAQRVSRSGREVLQ